MLCPALYLDACDCYSAHGCAGHALPGPVLHLLQQRREPAVARLALAGGHRLGSPPSAPAPRHAGPGRQSDCMARPSCPIVRARILSRRTITSMADGNVGAAPVYHEI